MNSGELPTTPAPSKVEEAGTSPLTQKGIRPGLLATSIISEQPPFLYEHSLSSVLHKAIPYKSY